MTKFLQRKKNLNSVEAYACACMLSAMASCSCNCSCTCRDNSGPPSAALDASSKSNIKSSAGNYEASVIQA
ncbi:MAG: hypothetical protein HDQ95_07075 [Roseburia sp.]|nr:hypothetical protein [Roseburia sp.]